MNQIREPSYLFGKLPKNRIEIVQISLTNVLTPFVGAIIESNHLLHKSN